MITPDEIVPMILPTVMIPFTLVSVGLSIVATFIAGLFGIQLKLEGPKKLLEVLLKPKVLLTALVLNVVIIGGIQGWKWWMNYPKLISTIEKESTKRARSSEINYIDVPTVRTVFKSSGLKTISPVELEQVWKFESGKGSFRGAVVTNDRVFTGNDEGVVSELELKTGKLIRTFYSGTPASTEITIWNNNLFFGEGIHDTHHARVYRFDLGSGEYKNSYQTLGHTEGQAVIGSHDNEDTLFVVGGADGLHAVDPITMKVKWKVNIGHIDSGVLVDNGLVYIGTGIDKDDIRKSKSYAAAIDFKTGEIKWQRELAASSWMRPITRGQNVCYISGEIYFPSQRGHLTCLDKISGSYTIAHNTTSPIAATAKFLDNTIVHSSIFGIVCRFDLETKSDRWCLDTKGKGYALAGASYDPVGNFIIYPSRKDGLYIIHPDNGEILLHWNPTQEQGEWKSTYADVTVAGDLWIVSDNSGSVRALKAKYPIKLIKE